MHDKNKIKSGFIWGAVDSLGTQGISLVISITLANILGPRCLRLSGNVDDFYGDC